MDSPVTIGGIILIAVVLIVLAYLSIRVVTEYERLVVFRLGKTSLDRVKGPGLVILIPIVDRPVKTDLREQFIEVPSQTNITRDNAPISIDFLIYWRIVDPMRSVVNVANFAGALQGISTTTLRAVIGDILLDDVLSKREQINEVLRTKLDEQTERWGGKVTTVEIREIHIGLGWPAAVLRPTGAPVILCNRPNHKKSNHPRASLQHARTRVDRRGRRPRPPVLCHPRGLDDERGRRPRCSVR
jgi:uncharacterized membrane protein YqiK